MSGVAEVGLNLALVSISTRRRLWMFGLVVLVTPMESRKEKQMKSKMEAVSRHSGRSALARCLSPPTYPLLSL
jgi:hypothetical protein